MKFTDKERPNTSSVPVGFNTQAVQMEALERATGAGFWNLDLVNEHLEWSPKTKEIHEVPDDFIPDLDTAINFYAPEDRDLVSGWVGEAVQSGKGWDAELQIITSHGVRKWVRAIGEPVLSESQIVGLAGSFRDITEAKSREAATKKLLLQKERAITQLSQVTDALDEAAIVTRADRKGLITEVNDQLVSISGYSREELIGQNHRILNSGYHDTSFFEKLWATISRGEVWRGEICNRKKSGELYWVDTLIYPVLDERGVPQHYLSIRFDITERIEASNLVTNFFDLSLAPHCLLDHRGRLQRANKAFCDLVGGKEEDLLGTHASEFVAPEDFAKAQKQWETSLRCRTTFPFRFRIVTRSGDLRHMEWMTKLVDSLMFVSGHDITIEVERRDALKSAKLAADEASNSKSAFLANMSHEIRTPLNAIIGVADVMTGDASLSPANLNLLKLILDAGHSLEHQLTDILDFSKLETGKLSFQNEPFSAVEAIKSALDAHSTAAREKGLEFLTNFKEVSACQVVGDSMRVRQIISNLASNAVKFTNNGKITAEIECFAEEEDVCLRFTIEDTGVGYPTSIQTESFGRFDQQGRDASTEFSGTGLGLAISSSIAKQMGGRLRAESEPGRGSKFTLELILPKARTGANEGGGEVGASVDQVDLNGCLAGRKILVVEDNLTNQKVVSLLLRKTRCDIQFAENGQVAIDAVATYKPDVVLMDMMMPVLDGIEATKEIRRLEEEGGLPRTPIVMLTANAMREHVDQALSAGCDGHVAKPVRGNTLLPKILDLC
ncbi:Autoinducer 2 sensor kinase/phosphatase LuxQ [Shimia sp. SK013]|uniref:PAS domain-containing hybrid sensor histidine kinase/response regulator n=1 Tax=Shimia sp. SK013 TaxID=1389006 RepID=UPI0006CD8F45|nr:PAS domain-containing hybrid sensor histidine kinase/response regulator [Shimia sp. SK013]KPA20489.1 Autoinducer 2 sensor kinase/phosphatase LuxQ [Shimia sp. SK013]